MNFAGLDYGSKLAGTSVIAWRTDDTFSWVQSTKGQDADTWLLEQVRSLGVSTLFIDAPLSLPGVYSDKKTFNDYFFRSCDRDTSAMSPMFLGGLTARAIKLADDLEKSGIQTYEVYPSQLRKELGEDWLGLLSRATGLKADVITGQNKHVQDAILAWYSGFRYFNNNHRFFGDEKEGLIIV